MFTLLAALVAEAGPNKLAMFFLGNVWGDTIGVYWWLDISTTLTLAWICVGIFLKWLFFHRSSATHSQIYELLADINALPKYACNLMLQQQMPKCITKSMVKLIVFMWFVLCWLFGCILHNPETLCTVIWSTVLSASDKMW